MGVATKHPKNWDIVVPSMANSYLPWLSSIHIGVTHLPKFFPCRPWLACQWLAVLLSVRTQRLTFGEIFEIRRCLDTSKLLVCHYIFWTYILYQLPAFLYHFYILETWIHFFELKILQQRRPQLGILRLPHLPHGRRHPRWLQEWGYKIYKGKKSRGSFLGVFETKSCIIFIIYRSILLPFSFSLDILSMPYRPWEDAAFAASFAATPRLPAVVSTPRFIRKAQSFLDSWMILLGSHGMWRDVTTSGWGYQVRSELFSWDHPMMFGCSGMFWDVLGCSGMFCSSDEDVV